MNGPSQMDHLEALGLELPARSVGALARAALVVRLGLRAAGLRVEGARGGMAGGERV